MSVLPSTNAGWAYLHDLERWAEDEGARWQVDDTAREGLRIAEIEAEARRLTPDDLELAWCMSVHGSKPPKVRPCKRHRVMAEWLIAIVLPRAHAIATDPARIGAAGPPSGAAGKPTSRPVVTSGQDSEVVQ